MKPRDELRTLRNRHEDLAVSSDIGRDDPDTGLPACLVQTTTVGSYPTATSKFFMCKQVEPGGTESEGATVNLNAIGGAFPVGILGSAVPPSGTTLIAHQIESRWVARYQ